jgi:putative aldouronate transport system permease protein
LSDSLIPWKTGGTKVAATLDVVLRLAVLFLVVLVFLPGVNPAHISEKINRNLSLFTSGFFYDSLIADMGRQLTRGWIQSDTMVLLFWSSFAACLGIFSCAVAACFSVGNTPLKHRAFWFYVAGGLVLCGALVGIGMAHAQLAASADLDKVKPLDPVWLPLFAGAALVVIFLAAVRKVLTPRAHAGEKPKIESSRELFLWLIPFLVLVFVFNYLPLWGWRYGFYHYQAGDDLTPDKFAGFHWFTFLFENQATTNDLVRVIVNTLAMSGLGILTSWVPLAFAVFLSEIRSTKFRRMIQTLTTIPNFISWVLVYAVAFCIFSTDGFLSSMMVNSGAWTEGKNLLMGEDLIWLKMLAWGMWKGLGWGAILYIAAITAIDPQLYEAATVDGAGRFQKMWHVTIPDLIPTYMVLLLLSIAGILNNGMEQYLVFENASNTGPITVLDLYVFKLGIDHGNIPLSTVVGMMKSVISVALLFGANAISKAVRGTSIV